MTTKTKPKRKVKSARPNKPYPEFPLYAHPGGYWAKKINTKLRYFGRWGHYKDGKVRYDSPDGWKEALDVYEATIHTIQAGQDDGAAVVTAEDAQPDQLLVKDLCNQYLTSRLGKLEAKEISPRTFQGCKNSATLLVEVFGSNRPVAGLGPRDFAACRVQLAKRGTGLVRLGNLIGGIRGVFVWGIKNGVIKQSINTLCGTEFEKPSKKAKRKERNSQGDRAVLTAEEIQRLLAAAKNPQLKAMILLGINCGFGNTDCSELTWKVINFVKQEINYPRPKTACDRRCILWPETIAALEAIERTGDRVFITKYGNPWVRVREGEDNSFTPIDGIGQEFGKLLKGLEINGRHNLGFYSLRRTFANTARHANDDEAVKLVMGHGDESMLNAHYTAEFPRERLAAIAEHVREWLFEGGVK